MSLIVRTGASTLTPPLPNTGRGSEHVVGNAVSITRRPWRSTRYAFARGRKDRIGKSSVRRNNRRSIIRRHAVGEDAASDEPMKRRPAAQLAVVVRTGGARGGRPIVQLARSGRRSVTEDSNQQFMPAEAPQGMTPRLPPRIARRRRGALNRQEIGRVPAADVDHILLQSCFPGRVHRVGKV
jgi:hypothetical protein